jgi:LysM repeat protein
LPAAVISLYNDRMVDLYEPHSRKANPARSRHVARQSRRERWQASGPGRLFVQGSAWVDRHLPPAAQRQLHRALDALWYLVQRTPFVRIAAGLLIVLALMTMFSVLSNTNIGPNIWVAGIPIGGLSPEDAERRLRDDWDERATIAITLDDEIVDTVPPATLGFAIDAATTVEQAAGVGYAGFPLGYAVDPVIESDYGLAQAYLLELSAQVYEPPEDAAFAWDGDRVVGVPGRPSRELDVMGALREIQADAASILAAGNLELQSASTWPTVSDPTPYLSEAYSFARNGLQITGYDAFRDETLPWSAGPEEMIRWIKAGPYGIQANEAAFGRFISAINQILAEGEIQRYVDREEAVRGLNDAIASEASDVLVRVQPAPMAYTVASGDTGYRIGRKTGLPFNLLEQANPSTDWNSLSIGQTINIPTPEVLLPNKPVTGKRIVVDLDHQYMVAFEDGAIRFHWGISSGRSDAPTYPGIFQILSHNEIARGSSYSLCNSSLSECGQWEMQWFMGVYEVVPGLMNGFHGAVLLPNGTYLGGGGVSYPSTFGCVMSEDSNARQLYDWAEIGTIVEIISSDYEPRSELGRQAREFAIGQRSA